MTEHTPLAWRHVPQLDCVRATAIVIVMASHAGLDRWVPGGFGVTLFFFLSGYLITSLLRSEFARAQRIDLGAFYLRRTVRIFPPMLLTIAVTLALEKSNVLPIAISWKGLIADCAFLTNYAGMLGLQSAVPVPLWSLDVEEHFYIGFSAVFAIVFVRFTPARAALACAVTCCAVLAIRIWLATHGTRLGDIYYWSHTRVDSILFGCVLALWQNPLADRRAWNPGAVGLACGIGCLIAALVVRDEVFRQTWRYSLQGVGLWLVFSWLLHLPATVADRLGAWPVRWVATLSYTLYLVHLPLLMTAVHLGLRWPWLWSYALAFAYAVAMYHGVERPLLRWRRTIERRRSPPQRAYVEPFSSNCRITP